MTGRRGRQAASHPSSIATCLALVKRNLTAAGGVSPLRRPPERWPRPSLRTYWPLRAASNVICIALRNVRGFWMGCPDAVIVEYRRATRRLRRKTERRTAEIQRHDQATCCYRNSIGPRINTDAHGSVAGFYPCHPCYPCNPRVPLCVEPRVAARTFSASVARREAPQTTAPLLEQGGQSVG